MATILQVNNLSKEFKDAKAVDDLSFSVMERDIYGFLGQNGAGKSTTIRMLLTLIKPTTGEISIFGKSLSSHRQEILRQTGAMIERPDLYKYLSAYDNLAIFARLSGIRATRKLIMDQLDMVGLADRSKGKVKTFSQGMKQRLGIAVALVHSPRLIILDEPTNGLDPQGIADMRVLILRLSRELGKTVIVSSHLLSEIELLATRMLIIHKGRKVAEGGVTDLLDPSKTSVMVETNNNERAVSILKLAGWKASLPKDGEVIQVIMNRDEVPALVNSLTGQGIDLLSLQPRHSLEQYFLALTNNDADVATFSN